MVNHWTADLCRSEEHRVGTRYLRLHHLYAFVIIFTFALMKAAPAASSLRGVSYLNRKKPRCMFSPMPSIGIHSQPSPYSFAHSGRHHIDLPKLYSHSDYKQSSNKPLCPLHRSPPGFLLTSLGFFSHFNPSHAPWRRAMLPLALSDPSRGSLSNTTGRGGHSRPDARIQPAGRGGRYRCNRGNLCSGSDRLVVL